MGILGHLAILSAIFAYSTGNVLDLTDVSGMVCRGKRAGDVQSHPLDCQAYFVCGPVPTIAYCDEGLHFDAVRKVCNWPEHAKCELLSLGNGESEQQDPENNKPKPEDSSSSQVSISSHPIFVAIDVDTGRPTDPMRKYDPTSVECRHFGAYFLPHPHSCRRYFICAYGHLHKHKCGHGTAWNYKSQECELDAEADCYSRSVAGMDVDAGSTNIPDENAEQIDALLTTSDDTTSTSTMPSTVCFVIDTTIVTGAPTGTTWNPTGTYYTGTGSTISTWNPTGTHHTPTGTIATPTLTSPGRVDGLSSDLKCPKTGEAYLPNIEDCSKYFICIAGRPVATTCPKGLYWDQNAEFCDLARNVKCYKKQ